MNHAYTSGRLLVRLDLSDTAVMTAHTGRRFNPDRATVEWAWKPGKGWTYIEAAFDGPTVAEDQRSPELLGLDRGFYRALPNAPHRTGHELPAEYVPLVQGSQPTWIPPGIAVPAPV